MRFTEQLVERRYETQKRHIHLISKQTSIIYVDLSSLVIFITSSISYMLQACSTGVLPGCRHFWCIINIMFTYIDHLWNCYKELDISKAGYSHTSPVGKGCMSSMIRSTTASQVISAENSSAGWPTYMALVLSAEDCGPFLNRGASTSTRFHQSVDTQTRRACRKQRIALSHSIVPLGTMVATSCQSTRWQEIVEIELIALLRKWNTKKKNTKQELTTATRNTKFIQQNISMPHWNWIDHLTVLYAHLMLKCKNPWKIKHKVVTDLAMQRLPHDTRICKGGNTQCRKRGGVQMLV